MYPIQIIADFTSEDGGSMSVKGTMTYNRKKGSQQTTKVDTSIAMVNVARCSLALFKLFCLFQHSWHKTSYKYHGDHVWACCSPFQIKLSGHCFRPLIETPIKGQKTIFTNTKQKKITFLHVSTVCLISIY